MKHYTTTKSLSSDNKLLIIITSCFFTIMVIILFMSHIESNYKKTLNEYELILYEAPGPKAKIEARKLIELIKTRKLLKEQKEL